MSGTLEEKIERLQRLDEREVSVLNFIMADPNIKINYVSHSNTNTRYYYMWKYLTPKTPCVLLEMGQSIDPHDSVLLSNTDLIAGGITRALCKAFNVNYEIVVPPTVNPTPTNGEIADLKKQILDLNNALNAEKAENKAELALVTADCLNKLTSYKEKIIQFINSVEI